MYSGKVSKRGGGGGGAIVGLTIDYMDKNSLHTTYCILIEISLQFVGFVSQLLLFRTSVSHM